MKYLLILISGRPRSGKNRAGEYLGELLGAEHSDHFALSDALKRMTHEHYGLGTNLGVFHFEDRKDAACSEFGGLTPRNAYIEYSENVLKPRFGESHLGELALRRVEANRKAGRITLLSGVGFLDEVLAIVNAVGSERTLHLMMSRPDSRKFGISDSREELDLTPYGVKTVSVVNDLSSGFLSQVEHLLT